MCAKINVIEWLASSERLVFRKKSCSLDVVQVMACSSRNNMLGFWTQVLGIQIPHLRLIKGQHLLLLVTKSLAVYSQKTIVKIKSVKIMNIYIFSIAII
jgi:hypothetical protein